MDFQFLASYYHYSNTTRFVSLHVSDSIFVVYSALQTPASGAKRFIMVWKAPR